MTQTFLWTLFALMIAIPAGCAVGVAYWIDRRADIELRARLDRRAAR